MKYLVILNKNSGNKDPEILKQDLIDYFNLNNKDFILQEVQTFKDITLAIDQCNFPSPFTVIAVGGDGTIKGVINKIAYTNNLLGIIPTGSANVLAKSLAIPAETHTALDIIFQGYSKKIDLGKTNGTYFAVTTGCGIDSLMIKETKRELKQRFGIFAYILNAFSFLNFQKKITFTLIVDGKKIKKKGLNIVFINTGDILGDLIAFKPYFSHHDDYIDICIYAPDTLHDSIPILLDMISSTRTISKASKVYHYKGKRIYLQTKPLVPVHVDGDIIGTAPLEIFSCPNAISILVPEEIHTKRPLEHVH